MSLRRSSRRTPPLQLQPCAATSCVPLLPARVKSLCENLYGRCAPLPPAFKQTLKPCPDTSHLRTRASAQACLSSLRRSTYISRSAPKSAAKAPLQTWNIMPNQRHSAIFEKTPSRGARMFARTEFFEFCNPLTLRLLKPDLADTPKPTSRKTRKNAPALTSTNPNSFSFRIKNIPGNGRLGPSRECPLESVNRGYMRNNVYKKSERGMWFGISDMRLIREKSKYEKSAPCGTGMSCRINNMTIRAQHSKWRFYSSVTSAGKTLGGVRLRRFWRQNGTLRKRKPVMSSVTLSSLRRSLRSRLFRRVRANKPARTSEITPGVRQALTEPTITNMEH